MLPPWAVATKFTSHILSNLRYNQKMVLRNVSQLALVLAMASAALAQTAIPIGDGSFASTVPASRLNDDGWFGPTPQTMLNQYATLFIDPSLKNRAIPTNQWWTDILIGQRGGNFNWYQQQFDGAGDAGQLWVYPGVVQPSRQGMNLYFPKRFVPNSSTNPNVAQGSFELGPRLRIDHSTGFRIGTNDVMLGDFMGTSYPAGWTASGGLVGTAPIQGGSWPGQSPAVTGLVGKACVNTFRGTDATTGNLTSPSFTISRDAIVLKVGGGSDTTNTVVQLIVGGTPVRTAVGNQDGALRWVTWNVSALRGQNAQIVIRDQSTGAWGFIMCNIIVATDNPSNPDETMGDKSTVSKVLVSGYSDWGVETSQTDANGAYAKISMARGNPFTWVRYRGISPIIRAGAVPLYDRTGKALGGEFRTSCFGFSITDGAGITRSYGVFAPDQTRFRVTSEGVQAINPEFLVYGLLPSLQDLATFERYAFARVVDTKVSWSSNRGPSGMNSKGGSIDTTWKVTTAPLKGTGTTTLMGFLPHHLRTTVHTVRSMATYPTPRGSMVIAAGNEAKISWPFQGIVPVLPKPVTLGVANDYQSSRMQTYVSRFAAAHPTNGADSYFQGKEFGLSAQNMALAAQIEDAASFESLRSGLRKELSDWYRYTPGKATNFFAWYPGWGSLVGFNSGFGSPAFNDHHFHYGYFTLATALLGMHDAGFLGQYGQFARHLAKDYNNWDRTDTRFPFMRSMDLWAGHCNAGGVSGPGGQNQESSSEAMNAWAGTFLLGSMLGDPAMADAGAFGFAMESAATNEYWQDWKDQNFPTGYGKETTGILTSGGIAYATYFSGDPVWIYGIQWTPSNHWNTYLVRDKARAQSQWNAMWAERQAIHNYNTANSTGGFTFTGTNDAVGTGAYPGNYLLAFQSMFDPAAVAATMDSAWTANQAIATDVTYPGIVYYNTHAFRGLGDVDETAYTSLPTSQVFKTTGGVRTYVLFNPGLAAVRAMVFHNGRAVGSIAVPARALVKTQTLSDFSGITPSTQFRPTVPTVLEAENFAYGGHTVAYQDSTPANTGGKYRPKEGVDITSLSLDEFAVIDTSAGEWMKYPIRVNTAGSYTAILRVASAVGTSQLRITTATGTDLTGVISVPNTGSAFTFTNLSLTLTLPAGDTDLVLNVVSGGP